MVLNHYPCVVYVCVEVIFKLLILWWRGAKSKATSDHLCFSCWLGFSSIWLLSHNGFCFCCSSASLAHKTKRKGHLSGTEHWKCWPFKLVMKAIEVAWVDSSREVVFWTFAESSASSIWLTSTAFWNQSLYRAQFICSWSKILISWIVTNSLK